MREDSKTGETGFRKHSLFANDLNEGVNEIELEDRKGGAVHQDANDSVHFEMSRGTGRSSQLSWQCRAPRAL